MPLTLTSELRPSYLSFSVYIGTPEVPYSRRLRKYSPFGSRIVFFYTYLVLKIVKRIHTFRGFIFIYFIYFRLHLPTGVIMFVTGKVRLNTWVVTELTTSDIIVLYSFYTKFLYKISSSKIA